MSVEITVDERRWDALDARVAAVEAGLAGLPDADAAPIAASLTALRARAAEAQRAERAEAVERTIRRQLSGLDPAWSSPEKIALQVERARELLDGEEAQAVLTPAQRDELRAAMDALTGSTADAEREAACADAQAIADRVAGELRDQPFVDRDEYAAGRAARDLISLLDGGRATLGRQPAHPTLAAVDAALVDLRAQLDAQWAAWELARDLRRITDSWHSVRGQLAGWDTEDDPISWAGFQFTLPFARTQHAVRTVGAWLTADDTVAALRAQRHDHPDVLELMAEARRIHQTAADRLHAAFDRLLTEAEAAPTATEHRDCERPAHLVLQVPAWFDGTAYLERNRGRAQALHDRWKAHVDELDRAGLALHEQLVAEATAAWPGLVAQLAPGGFDPHADAADRGPLLLTEVYNRARWDFDGSYDFTIRHDGVVIAGNFAPGIGEAQRDAARRTRQYVSDHIPWDVIATVVGPGQAKVRTVREVRIKDTDAKLELESWEPIPCLVIRIIALHAGPVAVTATAARDAA